MSWRSLPSGGAASFFLPLLLSLSCAPANQEPFAPEPLSSEARAVVTLLPSLGVSGGAEICFNALDDNGNQLIDEGCGVPQGELQVSLAWQTAGVDIDLYVTDPHFEIAIPESATRSGLTSTPDCPAPDSDCHAQNFESVYLEELDMLPGKYQVRVRLEKLPADVSSLIANLSIRQPQKTTAYQLKFFREGQEAHLDFHVIGDKKAVDKKVVGKKK